MRKNAQSTCVPTPIPSKVFAMCLTGYCNDTAVCFNRKSSKETSSTDHNRLTGAAYHRFMFNDLPVLWDDKPLRQRRPERYTDGGAVNLLLRMSTPKPKIRRRMKCTWSSS